jgi:hypothetical protein
MIIMVQTNTTEEQYNVIDKVLADGGYPIAGLFYVLALDTVEAACDMLWRMATRASKIVTPDTAGTMVFVLKDGRDKECLGFLPNTPSFVLLYGVGEEDFKNYVEKALATSH